MNEKDMFDFRESLSNLSLGELYEMREKLQKEISKMIMDSDLIMKVAVIEAQIQERNNG